MEVNKIDTKEFYRVKNTDTGKFVGGYNKNVWAQKGSAVATLNSKGRHNHNLIVYTATQELSGEHVVNEMLNEKAERKVKEFQGTVNNLKRKLTVGKILKTYTGYHWDKPDRISLVRNIEGEMITFLDVKNNKEFEETYDNIAHDIKRAKNYQIL